MTATQSPTDDPSRTLRELEEQLLRERARNEGLERGLSALSARVEELRAENEQLRRRAERRFERHGAA